MNQTHELRLKINASAAQTGSRKFVAAINAIKNAVKGLERDSEGAFATLRKSIQASPKASGTKAAVDGITKSTNTAEKAAQRLATSTTNALTSATSSAAKLRAQFEAMGDTSGLTRTEAALKRLKSRLGNAGDVSSVSAARADYRSSISGLQQEARASEQASRAAEAHARELTSLKSKYDPLYAASKQYEGSLEEIARAEAAGTISAVQAENARQRAAASLQQGAVAMDKYGRATTSSSFATANIAAQFNDIGVMLAAGQNPFQLAIQQGTQLSQILNQVGGKGGVLSSLKSGFLSMINPISLITVGSIALGATLFQTFTKGRDEAKSFADALGDARSSLNELRGASDALSGGNLRQLRSEYGRVNEALDDHLERMRKVAEVEAGMRNADLAASMRDTLTSDGNLLTNNVDAVRRAFDTTNDRARTFLSMLSTIQHSRTFADQAAAITRLRQEVESTTGGLDKSSGAARGMLAQLIRAEDFALKLVAAMDDNGDLIDRSIRGAATLTASLGTAADEAARMLQNFQVMPGAFSLMDRSIKDQLAGIAAQNKSLDLQLSEGLSAMAANRRVQLKDLTAAGALTPDQAAAEWEQIDQLDAAIKRQSELRKKLTESTKSGGGSKSTSLFEEITQTTSSLKAQTIVLEAVRSGLYESTTAADLYARAVLEGGGEIDAHTAKVLSNIDALSTRNAKLKETPEDFGHELSNAVQGSLESSIRDAFINGRFSAKNFVAGIKNQMASVFSKSIASKITDALGLEQMFGGGASKMTASAVTAGQTIGTSMVVAGNQAAAAMASAIATGQAQAQTFSGSGGGGLLSLVGSFFGFSEGGYSDRPGMTKHTVPMSAFANAPQYAEGTANTSNGIPAILHPNEAVVPLSRGRKIPVELGGASGSGAGVSFTNHTTVNVDGGGGDDEETAIRIAQRIEETMIGVIQTQIAEASQYGGALNPRGGV